MSQSPNHYLVKSPRFLYFDDFGPNFGQKMVKMAIFTFLRLFGLFYPRKVAIIFINFCMKTSLVLFFEKIIFYIPGKFWDGQNVGLFRRISSKRHYSFSLFLIWKHVLWSSLINSYSLWWENFEMAKLAIFWPIFGQNCNFVPFGPISSKRRYKVR